MLGATVFIRYLASLDGLAVGITEQRAAELCWSLGAAGAPEISIDGCPTASRRHCCLPERAATQRYGKPNETYRSVSAVSEAAGSGGPPPEDG